jgi:hypothetical protein
MVAEWHRVDIQCDRGHLQPPHVPASFAPASASVATSRTAASSVGWAEGSLTACIHQCQHRHGTVARSVLHAMRVALVFGVRRGRGSRVEEQEEYVAVVLVRIGDAVVRHCAVEHQHVT